MKTDGVHTGSRLSVRRRRGAGGATLTIFLTRVAVAATVAATVAVTGGQTARAVPDAAALDAKAGMYRVIVEGFTATRATWDHALEVDGKGDEVFLSSQIVYRVRGKKTSSDEFATPIMGDTNGFPNRVRAGSASELGGIRSGDTFPTPLDKRAAPPEGAEVPPLELWSDELVQGGTAVVITPTIWEYDGAGDVLGGWVRAARRAVPRIAASADKAISGKRNGGITEWTQLGLNTLSILLDVVGTPGDRPIGTTKHPGKKAFNPKAIVLTYQSAERLSQRRIAGVKGLITIQYRDHRDYLGNYTLWLRIAKVKG
jgi:hypothetical protein